MRSRLTAGVAVVALVLVALAVHLLAPDQAGTAIPGSGPPVATASRSPVDPETGLRLVELASLPPEARRTVTLVDRGGPFPYRQDGAVFGNREGRLPPQRSGWYHEYTVVTPGSADRGARRLITGDGTRQLFWTTDHYASFRRVQR